jgi:predicted GNAT family acetyltransferase
MHEAMHVLAEVHDPPRPSPGRLRSASDGERELLVAWERDFAREAGIGQGDRAQQVVEARLARGGQFVWDDDGPVSTLVLSPPIAGTVRIGPVYTPPPYRRRGYASSAVAGAARGMLAAGARRCMLFTDLANPTSNKIYAAVGFRKCGEWEEHAFVRP